MTKAELLKQLEAIPNDAVVCLVNGDGLVNDVTELLWMQKKEGFLKQHEVYLYPTQGRV